MRLSRWLRVAAAATFFVFTSQAELSAEPPHVYALVGGTVHPVSSPPLPNGTVVVRNGLIEAVGAGIRVPADAVLVDTTGAQVYPALFNAQSAVGIPADPKEGSSGGKDPGAASLAAARLSLAPDTLDSWRGAGVGTLLSAQKGGNFQGGSVIFNLGDGPLDQLVLRSPGSIQFSFATRSWGTYPDSLMGAIHLARQSMLDAAWLVEARGNYEREPRGKRRPESNPDLEALAGVLRREIPLVFLADDEVRIRAAAEIGGQHKVRWIVSGASEAWELADFLEETGGAVLVSVDFPRPPTIAPEDQPLRAVRKRVLAPTGPAELAKREVPFALVSGANLGAKEYIAGIRRAIEEGLAEDAVLRAVTLAPAQMFGLERQIGSIESGKIANLIVTEGKFWERDAKVRNLFVDGRQMRIVAPPDSEKSPLSAEGSWDLSVRLPEGEVALRLELTQQGERVSGSFSGDRGSGSIGEGTVEGNRIRFSLAAQASPSGEMSEWRFEGTITGNSMEGSVTSSLGTFDFSGRRPE